MTKPSPTESWDEFFNRDLLVRIVRDLDGAPFTTGTRLAVAATR